MTPENSEYLGNIIPSNNVLIERVCERFCKRFCEKVKKSLQYKNKKSNLKGIYLISKEPLEIRLTQKYLWVRKVREISKKSFFSTSKLPEKIKNELWNNKKDTYKEPIKNYQLLKILKIFDSWEWLKVYQKAHSINKEVHYFKSENWLVYDFKTIDSIKKVEK